MSSTESLSHVGDQMMGHYLNIWTQKLVFTICTSAFPFWKQQSIIERADWTLRWDKWTGRTSSLCFRNLLASFTLSFCNFLICTCTCVCGCCVVTAQIYTDARFLAIVMFSDRRNNLLIFQPRHADWVISIILSYLFVLFAPFLFHVQSWEARQLRGINLKFKPGQAH